MNILEINQELHSQLKMSEQQFRDLKEKFLVSEAPAYCLTNQLQKYKCEEHKGITESVLGEKMQFKEEKLAEKSTQAEELRRYKALVHSQALELTQLRKKLREGREASLLLSQHLKALLTDDDPDNHQGQDLREQLAEGRRLAECLVCKLSPGKVVTDPDNANSLCLQWVKWEISEWTLLHLFADNDEVGNEDAKDEKVEKVQGPLASRSTLYSFEKQQVCLALDGGGVLHCECDKHPSDVSVSRSHTEETDGSVLGLDGGLFMGSQLGTVVLLPSGVYLQSSSLTRPSRQLLEVKELSVTEDSLDESYLTPSIEYDLCDCHQTYNSTLCSLEEQLTCCALDSAFPTQEACPQGPWSGDLSHHLSEVQSSHAQLEPSTLVLSCVQLQLDQWFDYGYSMARQGPSSTTWTFTAKTDSGNQWPFQELGLEPSLGMKNPPQLEGDDLEGPADNTHGCQVIGHVHASSVLKQIIKRKLLLSKFRLACRFPRLQA
nr:neuroblastoma breakpoint family member 6-like [Macaca fascicularis]